MSVDILVVDDEKEIADLLAVYLLNEGYKVHKFYHSAPALAWALNEPVDLALLDVMLPDMDGFTLCKKIRESKNFPIIMLTAKGEEIDKITGLSLGADDYIAKPFRPLEVVARVKAQLRRYTRYNPIAQAAEPKILAVRGLCLNEETHQCSVDGREVQLTPTEFAILAALCRRPGEVISGEELFSQVWGEKYYSNSNNTVMVHIRHLREKIGETATAPKYLKTVWGVGYKIEK